jgi:hypothetical protein
MAIIQDGMYIPKMNMPTSGAPPNNPIAIRAITDKKKPPYVTLPQINPLRFFLRANIPIIRLGISGTIIRETMSPIQNAISSDIYSCIGERVLKSQGIGPIKGTLTFTISIGIKWVASPYSNVARSGSGLES